MIKDNFSLDPMIALAQLRTTRDGRMLEGTKQLNQFPATLSVSGADLIYSASTVTGIEQRTTVSQLQTYMLSGIAQSNLTNVTPLGSDTIPIGRSGLFQATVTALANFALQEIGEGSLATATALTGAEFIPISQNSQLVQTTTANIAALALSALAPVRQSIPVLTAGQSVYVSQGYSPGLLNVFVAGFRLNPSQYVALDGIHITISDTMVLGIIVPGMTVDVDAVVSIAVAGAATPASVQALDPANQPAIGSFTGSEIISTRQGAGLFQSSLTKIATWVIQTFQGFTQNGTGAVARTVVAKITDAPVSARDFGAKIDGVTDDTAAVTAAAAVYGRVYIPDGFCVVQPSVVANYADVLCGPGVLVVAGSGIPAGDIHLNTTLNVPAQFATIQLACDYLRARFISKNVGVTIKVADGTYNWSNIEPAIPQGDCVSIIGDQTTPGNCVINVNNANNASCFQFFRGSRIFLIDGFTINGTVGWTSHGQWAANSYGAAFDGKDGGAGCQIGANIRINKMYYGVLADCGAAFTGVAGGIINEAGDCGVLARWGGSADMQGWTATNVSDVTTGSGNNLGFGFMAEVGGHGHFDHSTASGCNVAGVCAQSGGSAWAHSFTSTNNNYGIYANEGGVVEANSATITGGVNGVQANDGGYVLVVGATASGCTGSGYNAVNGGTIDTQAGATANNNPNGFTQYSNGQIYGTQLGTGNTYALSVNGNVGTFQSVNIWATYPLQWASNTYLWGDSPNTLELQNGTNAQSFNIYNTYTNSSNYERGFIRCTLNTLVLGTEEAGTGVSRPLYFAVGGVNQWYINQFALSPAQSGLNFGAPSSRIQNVYLDGIELNNGTFVSVPVTGNTVTIGQEYNCQAIAPAGSLSSLTINFPTPLADGHKFEMPITQAITTLTLVPNSGASIVGGLTSTSGYTPTIWRYTASNTTWYRVG